VIVGLSGGGIAFNDVRVGFDSPDELHHFVWIVPHKLDMHQGMKF